MSTPPTPRSKAYKELLTTSLHRQFTNASALVLAFCLVESILLSNNSIFGAIFSIGSTLLRALLLFLPCLFVFVIRVQNLHFGARTTTSGLQTLYKSLTTARVLTTFLWYFAAALLFGEVYIWTKGSAGHLTWIDEGRAYERARLNENPILLRCLYGLLAVLQTGIHIWNDLDRVQLAQEDTITPSVEGVPQMIASRGVPVFRTAFDLTIAVMVSLLPIYLGLLRRVVWAPSYAFAKTFDRELAAHSGPSGFVHAAGLTWQACSSAFLLAALLGVSNTVFTVFMAQAPLKKGQPLTNDVTNNNGTIVSRAADANGSLINGLTRKKESPHTFALWELYLICTQFADRRRTIFLEVDRSGGSSWAQISRQCLGEIEGISARIQKHNNALIANQSTPQQNSPQQPAGLPRIASEQARQDDIVSKSRPSLAQSVTALARSAGQHPGAASPIGPAARSAEKALAWSSGRLLTKDQQQQLTVQNIDKQASGKVIQALKTPVGAFCQETFARTATAVVLGTPYSARTNITHAARALAALLKASGEEDTYGVVAKDVPQIVRTFLGTIMSTRQFLNTLQPNWTDVDFQPDDRQVPEVLEVVGELQKALETILLAFGEYAISLGMSKKELREAKEAVGMVTHQEMVRVR